MNEERPYLQIPLPSPEDERRLYEEWLKQQEEEKLKDREVIIIEMT
tara:strand:- start:325 stop:462 length:138 start_codon:yes stop_codon:yes gene_type:complete